MKNLCFERFPGPPTAVPAHRDAYCSEKGPARARLGSAPPGPQARGRESAGSRSPAGRARGRVPLLGLRAPRSPGQGLRRCFSNSDSSSRNSNQQVCGGVQGRLEVAASRSAASALILPPPPLPAGTLPGSNLTLCRGPKPGICRTARSSTTPTSRKPTQSKMAARPGSSWGSWIRLSAPPAAPPYQSLLELKERGGEKRPRLLPVALVEGTTT